MGNSKAVRTSCAGQPEMSLSATVARMPTTDVGGFPFSLIDPLNGNSLHKMQCLRFGAGNYWHLREGYSYEGKPSTRGRSGEGGFR